MQTKPKSLFENSIFGHNRPYSAANHSPFVTVSRRIQLLTLHGFRSNLDNSVSKESFQTGSKLPSWEIERDYWIRGYRWVIGVDEVGRGSLAGPVVAGAAALRVVGDWSLVVGQKKNNFKLLKTKDQRLKTIFSLGIDDSKRLTKIQRDKLVPLITKYFHCAIGEASVGEINRLGIVKATHRAMRRAIYGIMNQELGIMNKRDKAITFLFDGNRVPRGFQCGKGMAIVRGDQKSISIAAASIIAKVYRDRLMRKLAQKHHVYEWETNAGYGTAVHLKMIQMHGASLLHRHAFID